MQKTKRLKGEASKAKRREYQRQYAANYRKTHAPKNRSKYFREWEKRRSPESKVKKAKRDAIRYLKNRKEMLARNAEWHRENKERKSKRSMAHRKKHYVAYRAQEIRYAKSERGRIVANFHKRRRYAQKRDGGTPATPAQIEALRVLQKLCHYCGVDPKPVRLTLDHFLPLAKGGSHSIGNLTMSCKSCNSRKQALHPDVWARRSGFKFGQPPFAACY